MKILTKKSKLANDIDAERTQLNQNEKMMKCYHCGFVTNTETKFCPNCLEKEIFILLLPFMERGR